MLFETIVLQGEFQSRCSESDDRRAYCIPYSTRIEEIQQYGQPNERRFPPDEGHGYVWRLYTFTRYEQRDGGVYVELEVIALKSGQFDPVVRKTGDRARVEKLDFDWTPTNSGSDL